MIQHATSDEVTKVQVLIPLTVGEVIQRSFRAESMATEFASSMDASEVERAKLEVNAKLFPKGQGNDQNIPT